MKILKPYLVIPKLIEQPTWGGTYIASFKDWLTVRALQGIKIGQSYELYGQSNLSTSITDSSDKHFLPDGIPDLTQTQKTISLESLITEDAEQILGNRIASEYSVMPILIKFTQALGNSFQLHIKPGTVYEKWKAKPECWYFLEDGLVTLGLKNVDSVPEYRQTCKAIDAKMHTLSQGVKNHTITIESAKKQAAEFIKKADPWQFVNKLRIEKDSLVDLSSGGIHHSWEEDLASQNGNIVYEVQVDVKDEESTLRSFDQGKMKDDGSVRDLTIEEYFTSIDTDITHNDVRSLIYHPKSTHIVSTRLYSMDKIHITEKAIYGTDASFAHIFVLDGAISITAHDSTVRVTKGHSCFIPWGVREYTILPDHEAMLLKTFMEG